MANPIEFSKFYALLNEVKKGSSKKEEELEWLLAEYEHAKDSKSAFDELGQIFCHIGVMELYSYTGLEDVKAISKLDPAVWEYLEIRMKINLVNYLTDKMISHSETHELTDKIAKKWDFSEQTLIANNNDLARYVAEGIVETIN